MRETFGDIDVYWTNGTGMPENIRRVVMFVSTAPSPMPYIAGRALCGKRPQNPLLYVAGKHTLRVPAIASSGELPTTGWYGYENGDNTLIIQMGLQEVPLHTRTYEPNSNHWLFSYPLISSLVNMLYDKGIEEMLLITTTHRNKACGLKEQAAGDLLVRDFDEIMAGKSPKDNPVAMSLPIWLAGWIFALNGGKAFVVAIGSPHDDMLNKESMESIRRWLTARSLKYNDAIAKDIAKDCETASIEMTRAFNAYAEMQAEDGEGNSGVMFG